MIDALLGRGWKIIVRPHPEYTKRYAARWKALQANYAHVSADELYFEQDFSSNKTIFSSDIIITDWSSVSVEFAFSTCKPAISVDTKMKVQNPDWEELGIAPTDISLRDKIGKSMKPEELSSLGDVVADMLEHQSEWHSELEKLRSETIYNIGHSAEIAGEFLLEEVLRKQAEKQLEKEGE